ncbi:MAG: hypothetical protein JO031_15170 [Ktedonobacteraceae bacterium]|nr:hypothetical protein [Ktedonobacteraceae bacterium]
MDARGNKFDDFGEAGEYIWLRYGTQLTANGRSYTIEMNVPMPIGASEETREQLLREADAGMNQVANHVENRVAQLLQRVQPMQGKAPSATPPARAVPQTRPASVPAPQTGPQPLQPAPPRVRENTPEPVPPAQPTPKEAINVPPTRPNIGASMPSTPAMGDNSNLSLQQFIGYIRENMGLNPKQAMDLLNIKTLSGVNLREAVEQLQKIAARESTSATATEQRARETVPSAAAPPRQNSGPLSAASSRPSETARASTHPNVERPRTRSEEDSAYAFDEEVAPGESGELEDDLEDFDFPRELTAQERVQARSKLDNLREHRGATQSNSARQQVLMNVVDTQISSEQLQDLIAGVWNVTSIKKLKVDQVEALISWAKEDDFVSEVEAVLMMLEED